MAGVLAGKRVFLVEDNLGNRTIAQTLLEVDGAKVLFERWGTHTIQVAEAALPLDCILLDLMFPNGISGYDIFAQLRQHPELVKVPVVIVSAADARTEMPKARDLGFAGFISKPMDYRNFARQVAVAISGEKIWSAG